MQSCDRSRGWCCQIFRDGPAGFLACSTNTGGRVDPNPLAYHPGPPRHFSRRPPPPPASHYPQLSNAPSPSPNRQLQPPLAKRSEIGPFLTENRFSPPHPPHRSPSPPHLYHVLEHTSGYKPHSPAPSPLLYTYHEHKVTDFGTFPRLQPLFVSAAAPTFPHTPTACQAF